MQIFEDVICAFCGQHVIRKVFILEKFDSKINMVIFLILAILRGMYTLHHCCNSIFISKGLIESVVTLLL